jgi:hypothetical protein
LRYIDFQDRRLKPLSHLSKLLDYKRLRILDLQPL